MLLKRIILFGLSVLSLISVSFSQSTELSPFYNVASKSGNVQNIASEVKETLQKNGFEILGEYKPYGNPDLSVIVYTSETLKNITIKVEDRGALASVLKVGLVKNGSQVDISILNPEYLFYAYLRDNADTYKSQLGSVNSKVIDAFSSIGELSPFGGSLSIDDLKEYRYMMMMPYFDDPVELNEYTSFDEGLKVIRNNLNAGKGNTLKVYELIFDDEKVAVFGVGLFDKEDGEGVFLPIIGESHIAAMPYEIILQNNEVTMLHGKFRFALLWPELTMGTFMKISKTPGNVEDMLKLLTE